jgi:hypothetical protein
MNVVRPVRRCSRSLVFPAPPSILPSPAESAGSSTLGTPDRSPKEPFDANPSPTLHFGALPFVLADSHRPSLLGSSTQPGRNQAMRLFPFHRHASQRPLPRRPESRRFGPEGSTPEVSFRPRGFSPPRRVPPLLRSQACCIPLPILGSSRFWLVSEPCDPVIPPFPAMPDLPPEELPADSRSASPRPLPPCRSNRLRGVAPSSGLVSTGCRCQLPMTRSSLGFVPLQGPCDAAGDPSPTAIPRPSAPPKGRFLARQLRFRTRVVARNRSREPQAPADRRSDLQVRTAPVGPVPGNLRSPPSEEDESVGERITTRPKPCGRGVS